MDKKIPCANALELKRALAAMPDELLEGIDVVIAETDIDSDYGVELEFSESCKVLTILGNHL